MPSGVSSAPSVSQRIIDSLLQNIPGVIVYLDDILITGKTKGGAPEELRGDFG